MSGVDNSQFITDAVRAMNVYRQLHQVEPFVHNPDLDKIAQAWSDHLASTDTFAHNTNATYKGERLGENCAMKWSSDRADYTGQQCVDQWYSEIERYDFTKNSGPSTGHFTQVVWKASREVGLGRSQTKDGKWLVVGNFYPAGNYIGENGKNVFPTKDGKFQLPPKDDVKKSTPVTSGFADQDNRETMTSKSGESVKREVRTQTIGSGPDAVTKTIITETRTGPDGKTHTTTTEKITKGPGAQDSGDLESKFKSFGMDKDDDLKFSSKFRSFGDDWDDDFMGRGSRTAPSAEAPKQSQQDFIKDVIHWHNVYRAKHQVPELTENKELTEMAQKWAEHLASIGGLSHSNDKYKGQPVGENCAAKSGTGHVEYTGQGAVDQWYSESAKFDYSRPEGVSGVSTGHFSQVVWKSSKEIGIGRASSADGRKAFVVCNYFPAGNYRGEYAANVLPAK